MQCRNGDADLEAGLVHTGGDGEGGHIEGAALTCVRCHVELAGVKRPYSAWSSAWRPVVP